MRMAGLLTGLLAGVFSCEDCAFWVWLVDLVGIFFALLVFSLGWVEVDTAGIWLV